MLNVGYVVSTLARTGPSRQLLNLVSHLDPAHVRPRVLTLSVEPPDTLRGAFECAGIPVDGLGRGRLSGMIRGRRLLADWVREHGIDLLHTQGIRADLLACTLDGMPRIATLRNYPFQDYPMAYGLPGHAMARLHVAALRRLPQVAVVSRANRDAIQRHGVTATVVPNGVALEHFGAPTAAVREARRGDLGLPAGLPVVVTVGSLSQRKQPGLAIAAALEVRDAHIVVVGDGPLRETLARRYGGHPRVHLLGARESVEEVLQAADVFISTSRAEGLPNAVLEAMACSLPCVLSDIPPHREILDTAAAPAGTIVAADDAVAISDGLRQAWRARHEMGPSARAHAITHYSASAMARNYAGVYRQLAPRHDVADGVEAGSG